MNNLIKANNLTIGYGQTAVAYDINFEINEGDYLCIIGSNGAGKSTLIKTLLGFIPKIDGTLNININPGEIAYLPQQSEIQKEFPASVMEIVLSGRLNGKIKPFFTKEDKQIAISNMKKMGILDLKDKSYKALSGGQQQRVLLARALCGNKKILLLDEPVTGLDIEMTKLMYDIIEKLNKEKITIIMISHDIDSIKYASHILKIGNKCIFESRDKYIEMAGKNND